MGKEYRHKRDEKKKPQLSLKERRVKKHEKQNKRKEHLTDHSSFDEEF